MKAEAVISAPRETRCRRISVPVKWWKLFSDRRIDYNIIRLYGKNKPKYVAIIKKIQRVSFAYNFSASKKNTLGCHLC